MCRIKNIKNEINFKEEVIKNLELLNENQIKYVYHIIGTEKLKGK